MTAKEIVATLKRLGSPTYKHTLRNFKIPEPFYGVSVEEMKKIQKKVKLDYRLALDLYDTGIYDAMYLAGLIADDAKMTKADLQKWIDKARCSLLSVYTVPWVAAQSPHAREMALKWIESSEEKVASCGWSTLRSYVSITEDSEMNMAELKKLLKRVQKTIQAAPEEVRASMNGFLIAVGGYVGPLSELASELGTAIGPLEGGSVNPSCKIPFAPEQIAKSVKRGTLKKKRKSTKC